MGISLITRGRLWRTKQELIIRERITEINAIVDETLSISLEMEEMDVVTATVSDDKLSASVSVEESVSGEVGEEDISGTVKEC